MKKIQYLVLFAAALAAVAKPPAPSADAPQPERMKVLLDTDIGTDIDDAWALAFVIAHPGFEPVGITITDADTASRARIACKLLHLAGRDELPVAAGRVTRTPERRIDYQFQWAEEFTAKRPIKQPAAEFIVEQARRHQGELTLIAVGPLQNVADALRKDPELGKRLKRVVLMSGSIYRSAWKPGPQPEWNVVASTADAQLVYAAGLPLTIVPLDSTTLVVLEESERDRVRRYPSPITISLEALYRLWLDGPKSRMTLHDQLAVAEAARPSAFFGKRETLRLVVDDEGYTRIDNERGKPVTVCFEPKRNEFMEFYISGLVSQRLGMK